MATSKTITVDRNSAVAAFYSRMLRARDILDLAVQRDQSAIAMTSPEGGMTDEAVLSLVHRRHWAKRAAEQGLRNTSERRVWTRRDSRWLAFEGGAGEEHEPERRAQRLAKWLDSSATLDLYRAARAEAAGDAATLGMLAATWQAFEALVGGARAEGVADAWLAMNEALGKLFDHLPMPERTTDTKADTKRGVLAGVPANGQVLGLARRLRDSTDKRETKTDIARQFTDGDESKAQNLLRQLRRYEHLLNGTRFDTTKKKSGQRKK
jgi:hypothetical protein